MEKSRIENYELDLYSETLDNGLLINVVPKKNVSNIYVTFTTKYGSFHNDFIPIGEEEMFSAPLGVAHFLEHKVFEQESGEEPFAFYTAHGADANASTSHQKTTYLFSGTGFVEENIEYLLDFVQAPYFTEENVNKEKGIIEQEIKMYDDIPYWKLYEKTLENSFINHPIRYSIAGTIESINKITKNDLYTCYNTFYHPSNMFLTITGNVNPEKIINVVKNNQNKKNYLPVDEIVIKEYDEPDSVNEELEELTFDIQIPKASLSYKINYNGFDINRLKNYLNIFLSLKLGSTSVLNEILKAEKLISTSVDYEFVDTDKHLLIIINFESNDYNKIIEYIEKEIKDVIIAENDLNRKKKTFKSSCIFRSDSIYSVASKINSNILNYGEIILDEYELIDSLNIEEYNNIMNGINFNSKAIVILKK